MCYHHGTVNNVQKESVLDTWWVVRASKQGLGTRKILEYPLEPTLWQNSFPLIEMLYNTALCTCIHIHNILWPCTSVCAYLETWSSLLSSPQQLIDTWTHVFGSGRGRCSSGSVMEMVDVLKVSHFRSFTDEYAIYTYIHMPTDVRSQNMLPRAN